MNRSQVITILAIFVCLTLSCSIPGLASPTATPAGSNPPPQAGTAFQNPPVSGILPPGLGDGVQATTTLEVEFPHINPSNGDMPEHLKLTVQNYSFKDTILTATIVEFRAGEYTQYSEITHNEVEALKLIPSGATADLAAKLFVTDFHAQSKFVNFQNGSGMRYIGEVLQAVMPISNDGLFYFYHGLTADGQYYISVFLPVSAPNLLPKDAAADTTAPPGAVPFTGDDAAAATAYLDAVSKQLDAAAPTDFFPSLDDLDALVQSLHVTP